MIILSYKDCDLGVLSFDSEKQEFVYNSFVENENEADKKYFIFESYFLAGSKNRRSKKLFPQFGEIAACLTRPDIIRLAKIEEDDNLFAKLEKLSRLQLSKMGYFIRYKK